jgi:type II secretory pathway component PulJ
VNLKFKIFNAPGRAVSPLTAGGAHGVTRPTNSIVNSDNSRARDGSRCRKSQIVNAFTLVEILVVVVLMSLIILALMAVFNGTQAAFRASITQSDVLEGGRSVMGLLKGDLESMTPTFIDERSSVPNFYAEVSNKFAQPFFVGSSTSRTNVMEDVFFITRQNQTWKGVGYFVRTNLLLSAVFSNGKGTPGVLYRFETNYTAAQFAQFAQIPNGPFAKAQNGPFQAYDQARKAFNRTNGVSRILDGVMSFKVRAFDTNGLWITTTTNYVGNVNIVATNIAYDEVGLYTFYSNALPVSVEIELGVLEDRAIQRAESLPDVAPIWARSNYLAGRAGQVHLFRQRFPIRNVDPSAYR